MKEGKAMIFDDVNIIVTGASCDLGITLCDYLVKQGANVIGIYNKTKVSLKDVECIKCDITSEKDVKKLFEQIKNKYQKIDVLINLAALAKDDDYVDKTADNFEKVIKVNLLGTFLMIKYASFIMDKGVIINMSSLDASNTYNVYSMDYAASKAGVENLTKNFAQRLKNIKICALAPGWIETKSTLEMDPKFLKEELIKNEQEEILTKHSVVMKIIEMIINNDDYVSGDIVRMDKNE